MEEPERVWSFGDRVHLRLNLRSCKLRDHLVPALVVEPNVTVPGPEDFEILSRVTPAMPPQPLRLMPCTAAQNN